MLEKNIKTNQINDNDNRFLSFTVGNLYNTRTDGYSLDEVMNSNSSNEFNINVLKRKK